MSVRDEMLVGVRRYHGKVEELLEPMDQYFGINDLVYIEVSNDDRLVNLTSNRDWLEHCVEKKYFLDDPQMVTPNNMGTGYAMWSVDWEPHYKDEGYENTLLKDCVDFGIGKGITYINRNLDGYKVYIFSAPKENMELHTKLYSNIALVKKFVTYFDNEIKPVREELFDSRIDLAALRGDTYYSKKGLIASQPNDKILQCKFLRQLGILDDELDNIRLTNREIQCINLYLDGNSAQRTAEILSISRRTVESHMDSIKTKLKINYKRDLFEKVKVLKELELI